MRRVSILGLGAMGTVHARAIATRGVPGLTLAGFFDPDPERVPPFAVPEGEGVRRFPSEEEAIAAADVVVVSSPIAAHAAGATRALERGRDVLVEKPLAATPGAAAALIDAARAAGCRLFVGHSERFNPVVRALARLVAPTAITSLSFRRVGSVRTADALLVNLGVHDLDLASYLTRSPLMPRTARGDDATVDIVLSAARGCRVAAHLSRTGERERTVVLETRDRVWRGDLARFALAVTSRRTGEARKVALDVDTEPVVLQARALARALDGSLEPELATGRDAARAVHAAAGCAALLTPPRAPSAAASAAVENL